MADIVITIPNAQVERAVDALCLAGDYRGDPDDQAARRAFAKAEIARYVRRTVLRIERLQAAAELAAAAAPVNPIDVA